MLMASHSAVRINGQLQAIEFTPAYFDGPNTFGAAWIERLIFWKAIDGSGQITDDQTAFDYAVAVFELPIGLLTGWLGYRVYDPAWNNQQVMEHVGYPTDLANFKRPYTTSGTFHSADSHSFNGQTGYALGHVIDTAPGHSGGPYWAWFGDERFPRVLAVDSTGVAMPRPVTSSDNEAGGGPALSKLITYARGKYP
jgi:V8-like Glu-specific endopeptidase